MPEEARLHVLALERLAQQRVGEKVDLAHRKVIGGAPIRIDPAEEGGVERAGASFFPFHGRGEWRGARSSAGESGAGHEQPRSLGKIPADRNWPLGIPRLNEEPEPAEYTDRARPAQSAGVASGSAQIRPRPSSPGRRSMY